MTNVATPVDKEADKKAYQNMVQGGNVQASAPNAVGVSSPHIVQYPRPQKRDDGRWLALASIIGNVIGKLSSQGTIKEAKSAENKWRDVMSKMKSIADREAERVDPLRDKARQAMDDLDKRNLINWDRADEEFGYQDQMKPCIDNLQSEICAIAACGYTPDYDGIATRVAADAAIAQQKEAEKICRMTNRYNRGWECDVRGKLAEATLAAKIGMTNKLREQERLLAWEHNLKTKTAVFNDMENTRQRRIQTAHNFDKTAITVRESQYRNYTDDARNSLRMGADLLASHGQNAAWLADSLRKTAKDSMADWGVLLPMIGALIFGWNSKTASARNADCGGDAPENPVDKVGATALMP